LHHILLLLLLHVLRPPTSTLFPYTTLFRSWRQLEETGAQRERDDDVDHELPGQRRACCGEEGGEPREREGEDEALRARHRLGVLAAAHRGPGHRDADGLRRRGGPLRHARADHDRRARGGEAEREAEPLAPGPPDEGDGIHRRPSLPLAAAEHTGPRPAMESAGPGAYYGRCSASRASPPSGGSSRPGPGTRPRSRK